MEKQDYNQKIKKIFHSVFCEEVWVSVSILNENIDNSNKLENMRLIAKLNILTRSMLEYDKSYFSESSNNNIREYKPYFYSFIIYGDSHSNVYDKLKKMGDKWYKASFSKKKRFEWHEYRGEIEKSASPIIYNKHCIYISDEELDKTTVDEINDVYVSVKASLDCEVKKRIKGLLNSIQFSLARVYSVGNGNLINLRGNNINDNTEFNVMYDVGYHLKQHPYDKRNKYGIAVRDFHKIKPNIVFLSHWDDDHIMGCVYAQNRLFDCPWFAPEIEKTRSIGAKRLAAYLSVKKKLTIIKRDNNARKLVEISTLKSNILFCLGENKVKGSISKENCGGMIIEIKNDNMGKMVESLFCGDVPYDAIKDLIWNCRKIGYDILLVPHHGSKMNCSSLKIKKDAKAVVCGDGSSSRPEKGHKEALEAGGKGYNVLVTQDACIHPWYDLNLK